MAHDPDGENPNILNDVALPDFDDEDAVFRFVNQERGQLYLGIHSHAKAGDVKAGRLAETYLKALENQKLQRKKLEVEDKSATNMGEFAKVISEALDKGGVGVSRHEGTEIPKDYTPDFDVSEMPSVKLKEGIASTGSNDVDLDQIISTGLAKSGNSQDED